MELTKSKMHKVGWLSYQVVILSAFVITYPIRTWSVIDVACENKGLGLLSGVILAVGHGLWTPTVTKVQVKITSFVVFFMYRVLCIFTLSSGDSSSQTAVQSDNLLGFYYFVVAGWCMCRWSGRCFVKWWCFHCRDCTWGFFDFDPCRYE